MSTATIDRDFTAAFASGELSQEQAEEFVREQPPEVIVFTLLALAKAMSEKQATKAHTPPAAIPPFQKPPAQKKRKPGRRGAQAGHPGTSRPRPARIDHYQRHRLPCCPECQGKLVRTDDTRTRLSEDIPENLQPQVTEHTIHRDWCPKCQKRVEPKLPEVLPHCTLGNRVLALSAWLHYGNGSTISQIIEVLNFHLQMKVTAGGLVQMWHRLADILYVWYEQIQRECLQAAVLNADETGWRVNGQTHWLWCFTHDRGTFYMIDRSRGHPALEKFFSEEFNGVLVTDFWSAYDAFGHQHQRCWPHLLRDLKEVDASGRSHDDWPSFSRRLRRLFKDATQLRTQRATLAAGEYDLAVARLETRLTDLATQDWQQADAARLAKRLHKYGTELLTFLWDDAIPSDNNGGERAIRPAVLIRKNSYANHSDRGALTQAVLMSVYRTLRQRGLDPLTHVLSALRTLAETGQLPTIPWGTSSGN